MTEPTKLEQVIEAARNRVEAGKVARIEAIETLAKNRSSNFTIENLLAADSEIDVWTRVAALTFHENVEAVLFGIHEQIRMHARINRSTSKVSSLQDEYEFVTWCEALEVVTKIAQA